MRKAGSSRASASNSITREYEARAALITTRTASASTAAKVASMMPRSLPAIAATVRHSPPVCSCRSASSIPNAAAGYCAESSVCSRMRPIGAGAPKSTVSTSGNTSSVPSL